MMQHRVAVERPGAGKALLLPVEAPAVGAHGPRRVTQRSARSAALRGDLVARHRIPVDSTVVGGTRRGARCHRFHTRAALPLTISSRSRGSASANIAATIAFEFGKLVTGCG